MKCLPMLSVAMFAVLAWTAAPAQRATEVYIPIGESPGISESESVVGTVSNVEYENHQMTISTTTETRSVTLTQDTRYYIDKSRNKKRNRTGGVEDCEVGSRVEAYVNDDGEAIWVKVLAPE